MSDEDISEEDEDDVADEEEEDDEEAPGEDEEVKATGMLLSIHVIRSHSQADGFSRHRPSPSCEESKDGARTC